MSKKERIIVCRCEDVTLEDIEKAIENGCKDLGDLKRLLRCGMGPCQGRTCMIQIAKIISRKTGKPLNELLFPTVRFPIRPVPLGIFIEKTAKGKEKRGSTI
jgi:bacterioferritin-associated ferredoxin